MQTRNALSNRLRANLHWEGTLSHAVLVNGLLEFKALLCACPGQALMRLHQTLSVVSNRFPFDPASLTSLIVAIHSIDLSLVELV